MKTAEQVLADVAERIHQGRPLSQAQLEDLTRPYLPEPEPDRLTVAARECAEIGRFMCAKDAARQIRAIIAREVAAAEPSDEALLRVWHKMNENSGPWNYNTLRAALKGE